MAIWYIFPVLVYFIAIWYIFPVLVRRTEKNLATLVGISKLDVGRHSIFWSHGIFGIMIFWVSWYHSIKEVIVLDYVQGFGYLGSRCYDFMV
jgi:hypothetical protein